MPRDSRVDLEDILTASGRVRQYVAGMSRETFDPDSTFPVLTCGHDAAPGALQSAPCVSDGRRLSGRCRHGLEDLARDPKPLEIAVFETAPHVL